MHQWRGWLKEAYGKKLKKLHAWNAWTVLLLAVSGVILYVPTFRGWLGAMRVVLKQVHIGLGILSVLLLLMYVPLIAKHLKQLRKKRNQRFNLTFVLALLIGWAISGIILWQFRQLPPIWSSIALFWHDLLTWVGIPYALYHSISRSQWVKRANEAEKLAAASGNIPAGASSGVFAGERAGANASAQAGASTKQPIDLIKNPPISRRTFIRIGAAAVLAVAVGPSFVRWLFNTIVSNTSGGSSAIQSAVPGADGNHMLPAPKPAADSIVPIGGGLKGNFRIYTVTPIPAFNSDHWNFSVTGLVDKPLSVDWKQFLDIPRKVQVSDFHCVTGWSVYHITYEGILLSDLLKMVQVQPAGTFVKFYSGDGEYTDTLTLKQANMEDVMVAVLMDGKPIPRDLGGPIRLIVPKMYTYKSVKWLQKIELVTQDDGGYWEVRGYDTDAWVNGQKVNL